MKSKLPESVGCVSGKFFVMLSATYEAAIATQTSTTFYILHTSQ